MPRMPRFIEGVINYRDSVLPVINLVKRFELGDAPVTRKTKILVARLDDRYAGFVVSDVSEIMKFDDEEVEQAPSAVTAGNLSYLQKRLAKKEDRLYP